MKKKVLIVLFSVFVAGIYAQAQKSKCRIGIERKGYP